jgi:lipoyl(octanoyl) transferase
MPLLDVRLEDLGNKKYQEAWDYQEKLMQFNLEVKQAQRLAEINNELYVGQETKSHFLFVEHPHVFTLGKSGHLENLLANNDLLKEKDAEFIKTNRGGDITYHGPGQIVGYPILDLEKIKPDIVWYMRTLEEVIIKTVAHFGISAGRLSGATGVWLDADKPAFARKICAMGVRTSRWITMHGFALNVNTNLDYFNLIVPCGITDKQVTSMQKELHKPLEIEVVKKILLAEFKNEFGISYL